MKVGYIGLGAMGGLLARHLVRDHELAVYDLNEANLNLLAGHGAAVADSARSLAEASDVIILCLPRSSDVETVLFGPAGIAPVLRQGQLIIDQTSGVPALTAQFAERLNSQGVLFMDAPVSGGIQAAANRSVTVLASGDDTAWQAAEAVLQSISTKVLRCGTRVGDGQTLKLLTNGIGACYRLATLEILAIWRRFDLPLTDFVTGLNESTGANFTSRGMLTGLVEDRSTTDFAMRLMVKDLNSALDLGYHAGGAMPLVTTARSMMQSAISLFGSEARLDDVILFTEAMSVVQIGRKSAYGEVVPLPQGLSAEDLQETLQDAVAACNVVSLMEGVRIALSCGLDAGDISRVIEAGSAWCRVAARVFSSLDEAPLASSDYIAERDALEAAARIAAQAGLPFLMPGIALSCWRSERI